MGDLAGQGQSLCRETGLCVIVQNVLPLLFRYSSVTVTLYQKIWPRARSFGKSSSLDLVELSRNIMNLMWNLLGRTVWDNDSDMPPDIGG